jgi:hypothetical protein
LIAAIQTNIESKDMAFVNEFVSEEDIQRFDLDELSPNWWGEGRPPKWFRHAWTIDRERDLWLIEAKMIKQVGRSNRSKPTTKSIFILDWQGQRIRFLLDYAGSSDAFSDAPFHRKWSLLEKHIPATLDVPRQTVLSVLKEALVVYGLRGAHRQVPNTLVTFSF